LLNRSGRDDRFVRIEVVPKAIQRWPLRRYERCDDTALFAVAGWKAAMGQRDQSGGDAAV
jgi:hypothetical protein